MLGTHTIHKIMGVFVLIPVAMVGLWHPAFQPHGWAQSPPSLSSPTPSGTSIHFAPDTSSPSLRMDFAELEAHHPLTLAQRLSVTPQNLEALSQEQLDQLYARLTAGPMPDGPFQGKAFLPHHHRQHLLQAWQMMGLVVSDETERLYQRLEGRWMELWMGKVFDRPHKRLSNQVNLKLLHDIAPLLGPRFDQAIRPLPEHVLLFPARMYCGQSRLDSRRESLILDYTYNEDLPDFHQDIDHLVGKKGLRIRDEMRLIRPGLYLGRVYVGKVFLVNFLVMNPEQTQAWERQLANHGELSSTHLAVQEDCWTGRHPHQPPSG